MPGSACNAVRVPILGPTHVAGPPALPHPAHVCGGRVPQVRIVGLRQGGRGQQTMRVLCVLSSPCAWLLAKYPERPASLPLLAQPWAPAARTHSTRRAGGPPAQGPGLSRAPGGRDRWSRMAATVSAKWRARRFQVRSSPKNLPCWGEHLHVTTALRVARPPAPRTLTLLDLQSGTGCSLRSVNTQRAHMFL